jgi:CheY-like chemotaxis protein
VTREPAGFDLVLMDLQMPVMDGLEATRAVKHLAPGLPVVGQTAHAMPEDIQACLNAGMVATVTKPIDHEALVWTILQHAHRAQHASTEVASTAPDVTAGSVHESLIDWVRLDQRHKGRKQFVDHLLGLTLTSLEHAPSLIRSAATAGDVTALIHLAHRVKGTCGELFANQVQAQASATEKAARASSPDAATKAEHLAALAERFLAEVKRRLAARSPAAGQLSSGN